MNLGKGLTEVSNSIITLKKETGGRAVYTCILSINLILIQERSPYKKQVSENALVQYLLGQFFQEEIQ